MVFTNDRAYVATKLAEAQKQDTPSLKVIFVTHAHMPEHKSRHFLDEQGSQVAGIQMIYSAHRHHTARCSADGIDALSKDPRIASITLI